MTMTGRQKERALEEKTPETGSRGEARMETMTSNSGELNLSGDLRENEQLCV